MVDHSTFFDNFHGNTDSDLKGAMRDANVQDAWPFEVKSEMQSQSSDYRKTRYDHWPLYIETTEEEVSSEALLIVPTRVPGYEMEKRTWGESRVVFLSPPFHWCLRAPLQISLNE